VANGMSTRWSLSLRRTAVPVALTLVASLGLAASRGEAGPAAAQPSAGKATIRQVQSTIDALNRQAEIASEDLNTTRVTMSAARERLDSLRADVRRQRTSVGSLRARVVSATLSDYQSAGGLSTTTSFLVADNPKAFLTKLADDAVAQHEQAAILARLLQQQNLLTARQTQARVELDAVRADRARLSRAKAELAGKITKAKSLLSSLQAKQRARLQALQQAADASTASGSTDQTSRDATRPALGDVAASGRAQIAVRTALAQIGDPYVYGAAGPDAFDCSGLTMYAWAAAGVALPHSAAMQASLGTPVSLSDLSPGDLVFYYSPISHVAMYIGHGDVVEAPHTGANVQIVPVSSMPVAMAARMG
jgi:cell wall-associated NlpC family hydrolase